MRHIGLFALLPILAACATGGATTQADYQPAVAQALNHVVGAKPPTSYSISAPWSALTGRTMVCARRNVPDGAGGIAPTTDYSMFEIDQGRIIAVIQDQSLMGCPNRAYSPLSPA